MVRLIWITVYLISLAMTLMCGIAAIVIFVAILTGKFTDPEAWISVLLLAAVSGSFWLVCRAAKNFTEQD